MKLCLMILNANTSYWSPCTWSEGPSRGYMVTQTTPQDRTIAKALELQAFLMLYYANESQ